jgi:hypothetical protein
MTTRSSIKVNAVNDASRACLADRVAADVMALRVHWHFFSVVTALLERRTGLEPPQVLPIGTMDWAHIGLIMAVEYFGAFPLMVLDATVRESEVGGLMVPI